MYSSVESSPAGTSGGRWRAVLYEPIFIKIGTIKSVARFPPVYDEKSLKQLRDESQKKIAEKMAGRAVTRTPRRRWLGGLALSKATEKPAREKY